MQASPDVQINRYATAYIQPEYDQLRPFNTARNTGRAAAKDNPIPALTHFNLAQSRPPDPINPAAHWDLLDIHHGAGLSRTELYWTVYVATGFQGPGGADGDSLDLAGNQINNYGGSINRNLSRTGLSKTVLFAESTLDLVNSSTAQTNPHNITANILLARAAVHEVGHQFGLVVVRPPPQPQDGHRPGPNLMNGDPGFFPDRDFVFHPIEVVDLRTARQSP
jgi:hypothetical protein